jgi:hypothetical protein
MDTGVHSVESNYEAVALQSIRRSSKRPISHPNACCAPLQPAHAQPEEDADHRM